MASTYGRKTLPLPPSLVSGLESLGFVAYETPDAAPGTYRMPRHPDFHLVAVASNIPGDTAVTAQWSGEKAQRIEVDSLLVALTIDLMLLDNPNQKRRVQA